jgi:hypothetical protein
MKRYPEDKEELLDYLIRGIVNDIVERYLYMTNDTESVLYDIEKVVKPYVALNGKKLIRIFVYNKNKMMRQGYGKVS